MFYSVQLLAKKGPLGTVWIAGHLDKRLKRNQIYETNISSSVDSIINPEAPLALRLSGQLLLGVVRIYSRKINYLYSDCNEALVKIRQAFKAGDVDLPTEGLIAPMHAITLPDNFNNLDFGLNGPSFTLEMDDEGGPVTLSYGRRESFVLADDMTDFFGSQRSVDEEQFEAGGEELRRHFSMDGGFEPEKLRAAPSAEAQRQRPDLLFTGDSGQGDDVMSTGPREDEMLAPPPDDLMFGGEEEPPAAPPSEPAMPSPVLSDGLQALADLGPLSTPGSIRAASNEAQDEQPAACKPPRPARQALNLSKRQRPAKLDVTSNNKQNTELPKSEIMGLLKDPSSLVKIRDSNSKMQSNKQIRNNFHVASYSELAQESLLHWPAVSSTMAPELFSLYRDAMTSKQELAADRQRTANKATQHACGLNTTEEATVAAAAADEMAARAAAEPEAALNGGTAAEMGDPMDFGGPRDMQDGVDLDLPQPTFSDQEFGGGGDVPMREDQHEGLSPAGPAEDVSGDVPLATPPLTDGHAASEAAGSQGTELASVGDHEQTKDSFTSRTKMVLSSLQTNFEAAAESGAVKKRRLSSSSPHRLAPEVSMNSLVEGKGRKDASRWFFEMLVLKTRNYVSLKQDEPYGDIAIAATSKLLTAS